MGLQGTLLYLRRNDGSDDSIALFQGSTASWKAITRAINCRESGGGLRRNAPATRSSLGSSRLLRDVPWSFYLHSLSPDLARARSRYFWERDSVDVLSGWDRQRPDGTSSWEVVRSDRPEGYYPPCMYRAVIPDAAHGPTCDQCYNGVCLLLPDYDARSHEN